MDDGCRALFEYTKDDRRHDYRGRTIRVRLESEDRRYRRYNADIRGEVQLIRQISGAPCRLGRSWGYDRDGLWVDDGCRADFLIHVR